ncbi:MAG TPA: TIM-barrel domain-containing protein [Flavisolibacter sp.]|jgi:alpha-glucosidase (family GH31 glycosyl hydrolase)|nr:TIM-barrel domain-containing protein [Flavisolibacter sp.]
MKRIFFVACLFFVFTGQSQKLSVSGNRYQFSAAGKDLVIEFCTPTMFRVRTSWNKAFEAPEHWMVVQYQWQPVGVRRTETVTGFQLSTDALTVKIAKPSLTVEVVDKAGNILSSEAVANGGVSKKGDAVQCTKRLAADEHFFGFGERMDFLDRRGKRVSLNVGRGKGRPHIIGAYNVLEANYSPVPFFMSTKGYGIFFHNAFPTHWDMGSARKDAYSFSADGGEMDYYFIYGPMFPSILNQYTTLTGKAPLMPKAAYGLHVGTYSGGTWGYEHLTSDRYVIELARKLREMGIPVDLLWLDSTWRIFGDVGGKGATSFEWRETFQNPKAMFDSLYAMNFKMVGLHLRPRFDNGKTVKLLDTAQRLGFTYREGDYAGEFVNFFDSVSVDFWWNRGVKRVADIGAMFLKTDEGSAFGGLANESDKTGPQGADIAKLHNLFPLAYAKAPYEKFQQYNKLRGLNQTREGYAGIQRYPYIFAGDWPSEWQYFAPVIKAGLNIGLSGVGNWAHCMGGFEHPADPELYIRWVQFGMLSPVAMVFGMDHPGYKEPWNYGEDALRNFKKYDSLRYRLLPYIYSHAYQMYQTGAPLMRALVLDYQEDENVYEISDQYLFGRDLMVCPVTTKGAQTRTVYLPDGDWYDYWTGKKYSGKQYVHVVTPLDTMPIFARAGAILPQQPVMQYVDEKPVELLTLEIFPGRSSSFSLYEDDGNSLHYQDAQYRLTPIRLEETARGWQLRIQKAEGNYKPDNYRYRIKFHLDKKPAAVSESGSSLKEAKDGTGWYYDEAAKTLFVQPKGNNQQPVSIDILK